MNDTRLILCRNCPIWEQSPNPEQGTCTHDDQASPTNYDSRCILGISEKIEVPEIQIQNKQPNQPCKNNNHDWSTLAVDGHNENYTHKQCRTCGEEKTE